MIIRQAALISFLSGLAFAQKSEKVNISIQPAFHATPIFAALKKGWFHELGLDVTLSLYDSGAPQVKEAVENKAWDFGIAGSVPNVLAGAQGIKTIGINNDESATTEVFGAPGITTWPPENLYDGIFTATASSTGELLLRKCLEAKGIDFSEGHVSEAPQSDILERLEQQGENTSVIHQSLPSYGSLWAPNTYTYESENPKHTQSFCSGKDVDFPILGGLMVRGDYAEERPEIVAKILAAYLRGVSFMQNAAVLDQVIEVSLQFHEYAGIPVSEKSAMEDLLLRPLFNLDQQLDAMNRNFANNYESELDKHYIELEEFLFSQNVIEQKYLPKEYVSDEYMKMVSFDPELRAFAYSEAFETTSPSPSPSSSKLSGGAIAGIVLGSIGIVCFIAALVLLVKMRSQSTAPVDSELKVQQEASTDSWRKEAV